MDAASKDQYKVFGPYNTDATFEVILSHGDSVDSKMIGPLSVSPLFTYNTYFNFFIPGKQDERCERSSLGHRCFDSE